MIDKEEIINKIKQGIIQYTGKDDLPEKSDIKVEILDNEEFSRLCGAKVPTDIGGFYNPNNKTVYMLKEKANTNTVINNRIHNMIHEMLHAYSDNSDVGKEGLILKGYDINNNPIIAGGAINEAATEYLTSIITKDGFRGYPDDMKYIFELFIDTLNIRQDFVNIYFQKDFWITDEMNKRFNSSKKDQLDEFVLEFDNRLPLYGKKPYDPDKTLSILLDAVSDKITNSIDINYESIVKDLFSIKKCQYFKLNQDTLNKMERLAMIIESSYGIRYDGPTIEENKNVEVKEGTINITF